MIILPAGAALTLTGDDAKFLTDLTNEGVPLLFEIPAALNTGFFQGENAAIASVGQEKMNALDAFVTKVNAYTLSDEVKKIRDQVFNSTDIYKKDIAEYSTLVSTCGSCVSKMNEIYPRLEGEAKKVNKLVITFYQTSQAPIN